MAWKMRTPHFNDFIEAFDVSGILPAETPLTAYDSPSLSGVRENRSKQKIMRS
jgi:hypothetical protein